MDSFVGVWKYNNGAVITCHKNSDTEVICYFNGHPNGKNGKTIITCVGHKISYNGLELREPPIMKTLNGVLVMDWGNGNMWSSLRNGNPPNFS